MLWFVPSDNISFVSFSLLLCILCAEMLCEWMKVFNGVDAGIRFNNREWEGIDITDKQNYDALFD